MIPLVEIAPGYLVPRIILGGWQLSSGHSGEAVDREAVFALWDEAMDRGFNTLDCADIYTGVETLIGEFIDRRRARGVAVPQVHTKLVPDLAVLPTIHRRHVEQIVDRSLRRLRVDRLDLVQFHWWDYAVAGYLDVLGWLADLVADGKLRAIGLTNFDTLRLKECLSIGVPIASLQLQYSVLDQRPARGLDQTAQGSQVALLCYGTVAGGFLSEQWLAVEEPNDLTNRSLIKYRLIIEEVGGWPVFQRTLQVLSDIARRQGIGLAAVATRWVLGQRAVAAAIVGCRSRERLDRLDQVFGCALGPADRAAIAAAVGERAGPPGDVYDAERVPGGRHAAIMRYDLNARATDGIR